MPVRLTPPHAESPGQWRELTRRGGPSNPRCRYGTGVFVDSAGDAALRSAFFGRRRAALPARHSGLWRAQSSAASRSARAGICRGRHDGEGHTWSNHARLRRGALDFEALLLAMANFRKAGEVMLPTTSIGPRSLRLSLSALAEMEALLGVEELSALGPAPCRDEYDRNCTPSSPSILRAGGEAQSVEGGSGGGPRSALAELFNTRASRSAP